MFGWDFYHCLKADSILSVSSGIKGQEVWSARQLTANRPPNIESINRYFQMYKPNVVLFLETPFNDALYKIAPKYGCKTVAVPMHETFSAKRLAADLLICPCPTAYEKAHQQRKKLLYLPISIEPFPFRKRTGHTFVMNIGYGYLADRRQVGVVVKAFKRLGTGRLILHAQQRWPQGIEPDDDKRITWSLEERKHPRENYVDGDILLAPMAYEGYGRTVLEGMASGMPVLTTNADPMNLSQHDGDFLIDPCEQKVFSGSWVKNVVYNRVSVDDMEKKLRWLLTIDTEKYSRRARKQAEAQSWESKRYTDTWLEALREA